MDTKLKQIIAVLCVLVISGLAAAHCGNCPGDKKACPADCKKACCQKADTDKKACSPDCQKACCQKADAKKACPADCQKACCQKACPADCTKACCKAQTAPDFTLKDLNGKDIQLSKLKEKGKIVVLEWTNYDCPFVKAHYNEKNQTTGKLAEKYKEKDVVWLTINSTHYATAETNKEWAQKNKLKQAVLVDADGKVGKLFKAKTTPHLFIIDKKGNIAYQGAIDNAPLGKVPEGKEPVNYVDKALAELLEGQPVTTAKTKPYGCSVKYTKNTDS